MTVETKQLDTLQNAYKNAVDHWIKAIEHEQQLGLRDHSIVEIDAWEQAGFDEEKLRFEAKSAKAYYEDALRQEFYGFHGK